MKRLKKNIATAVALAMVIGSVAPTAQAYSENSSNNNIFSDLINNIRAIMGDVYTAEAIRSEIQAIDTELSFNVRMKNGVLNSNVGVEVLCDGSPVEIKNLSVTGEESKQLKNIKFNVAENTTSKDKVYEVKFTVDKNNPDYKSSPVVTVTQKAKTGNETNLTGFKQSKEVLNENGGEITFSIEGTNLDSTNYSLEIINDLNRNVTDQLIQMNGNVFSGTNEKKVLKVKFPPVEFNDPSIKEKKYTVNLKANGLNIGKTLKVKFKKEEIKTLIKSVSPKEVSIDSNAQIVNFKLTTDDNLDSKDILCKVKRGETFSTITPVIEGTGSEKNGKIEIPENTGKAKVYTVQFADKTNMTYSESIMLTINQATSNKVPSIENIIPPIDGTNIPKEGKKIEFKVNAPNVSKDKLGVKVTSGSEVISIRDITISGDGNMKTVSMTLPENKEQSKKIYKIVLCKDKSNPVYEEDKSLIITQDVAEAPKEMKIESFKAVKADLPKNGGTTGFTVKGENLDKNKLSLKVEKLLENGKKVDVTSEINGKFEGTSKIMSASLTFPKTDKPEVGDNYEVTLIVDSKETTSKAKITVSKYGTLAETTVFRLAGVYMDGNNKIILESEENLFEIMPNSLKENISLKIVTNKKQETDKKEYREGFVKLSDEDKVELKDNFIVITLKDPIDVENLDVSNSFVKIEERVLKNSEGLPFGELNHRINKEIPVVHEYEFIKGYILDSKGGEVAVKLKGINLVNPEGVALDDTTKKATRVRVFKKENLNNDKNYLDGVKVEGEGKEQIIRFTLPENKGEKTESYTVMISLNNGKTYSPEVGVNMMDSRGTRITPSVLPKGIDNKIPTLGFASIQSYGTAGGGASVDNTHTNTPTNQESKKTFVHLYGTNLEKNKTKVRIKHIDTDTTKYPDGTKGTGAIFTPTNEPAKDSGDRFTMVGFDGTGIIGDGNHQQLEIIAPRGYRGTNTWEYQFAVDGVNFDEKITVTVTVVNDKEEQNERPNPEEAIRDLTVKHITADGKEVAESEIQKVFKGQQFYSSGVAPKKIKGYKYLGVKEVNEAKIRLEELKKKPELSEKEKEEKAKLENLFNNVVNQKHKELEMCFDNKPGEIGVLTFLYERENTPIVPEVPEKPSEPNKPSIPSIPEKPQEEKPEKPSEGVQVEVVDKIAGENRYETSLEISQKVYSTSEKVYLVSGEKFSDALSSAALAGQKDGPILLINDKNIDKILAEINRLGAKEIVFVGGNSISKANEIKVEKFAKDKFISVKKLIGKNRFETAIKVAEETIAKRGNKGKVIIADGRNYPDAVSIAPYSSKEGIPVILVNGNKVPDDVKSFLNKYKIKEAIIVGGTEAVGKDVEKLFDSFERIAGEDRYDTSKKVAERLFAGSNTVFIASGESFADSLSVSYYAGNQNAPVLLTKANSLDNDTRDFLNANKDKNYIIIGGDKAVNPNLFK